MKPLRSSDLSLYLERCPAALEYRRRGTPIDRDGFAAGIAAHAMMQALGEGLDYGADPDPVIDRVAHLLLTEGRSFDGAPEPPLPPDAVLDARRLARAAWFHWPFPPGARCERGLAINEQGRAVRYDSPAAMARGILDLIYPAEVEIDGEIVSGVAVRDYKSAWRAGNADMPDADSRSQTRRQMRLYALFAIAANPDAAFIRVEIANLRTLQIAESTIWLDDAGQATIAEWLDEVRVLWRAMNAAPPTPRPGAGCPGCPYARVCVPGLPLSDLDIATRYAAVQAERDALRAALVASGETHKIDGGIVGYITTEARAPKPDAMIAAAAAFGIKDETTIAWLSKLKPTTKLISDAAAACVPVRRKDATYKDERQALVEAWTDRINVAEFGVQKDPT